ncbi:kinesin-like protein KIF20B [Rhinatrema bivittatum]|uniref:kinesin-like protein KIF20B n=1 Tax=Rhinatrema bivittatum TaxID=194408 RepID=UPI001128C74E|nr:kinesin-like protein KIF20B [Rhinatrema bivittatum]
MPAYDMEPPENQLAPCRPSYVIDTNELERAEQVHVDDIKTNLLDEFSLACPGPSQMNSMASKEPLQVYVRIKPFSTLEIEQNESQDCITIQDDTTILLKAPRNSIDRLSEKDCAQLVQKFTFSHVFGHETTQVEFFEGTLKQPVREFLEGQNSLIFTYGVTNAGKTYTFQGTETDAGFLPRSMNMLFDNIQGRLYSRMDLKPQRCREYTRLTDDQVRNEIDIKNTILRQSKEVESHSYSSHNSRIASETDSSLEGSIQNSVLSNLEEHLKESDQFGLGVTNSVKFSIWVSFCEIYNECIYDLLDPISSDKLSKRKTLRLAQDIKGCSFIKDLQWIQVSDSKEAHRLLNLGKKYQSIASTKLNSVSSRSHSIFTIRLLRIEDDDGPRVTKISELSLCDLAGSERCTKTKNEGHRLKESGNINTSLLILGKCINALKNSQQSKLQQHVPFRESKLTHYLQSFFCGKGKIYTIVNIGQSASAYDETLNVLRFSAVAQKVLILDTSKPPQAVPLCQKKSARDVSFIINNADNKMWASRKRATIHWDSQLEDVLEDESNDGADEVLDDDNENCPEEGTSTEENDVVLKMEDYQKLLDLIEDLKNKLRNEKREKLLMELKIREEVAQEFTQHFVQQENNFSECLKRERELLEDRCDERIKIFQNLISECAKEGSTTEETVNSESFSPQRSIKKEPEDLPLENFIDSVQSDLTVIKKQAIEAQWHISSISEPQEAIVDFEKRLAEVSDELTKTKEKLAKKTHELEEHMKKMSISTVQLEEATKKIAVQNTRIEDLISIVQEKECAITKLQDLVSYWEKKMEDYDKTVSSIKGEMLRMNSKVLTDIQLNDSKENSQALARKRLSNEHVPEEQPPTKKGTFCVPSGQRGNTNGLVCMQRQTDAKRRMYRLRRRQSVMLKNEKAEKQEVSAQVTNWQLALSASEKKALGFSEEMEQMKSNYRKLISELQTQKDIVKIKTTKVKKLAKEVEDKIVMNLNDLLDSQKDQKEKLQLFYPQICTDLEVSDAARVCTFPFMHIEGLWKECQQLVKASSLKNYQIQELEKQLTDLKKEVDNENEKNKLKVSEITVMNNLLQEKENLVAQLEERLLESSRLLEAEKQYALEVNAKHSELAKQVGGHQVRLQELECLLEAHKSNDDQLVKLEKKLNETESAVLDLEKNLKDMQQKYQDSEKTIAELNEHEMKMKDLQNKLKSVQCSLEEKNREEENKETRNRIVQTLAPANLNSGLQAASSRMPGAAGNHWSTSRPWLSKELADSSAHVKTLTMDLQRKNEEYTDLKEKLGDAIKQIHQVEKEVSTMLEEKKLLTKKINEYERKNDLMSRELDSKQRTIQQLGKEQLDNKKLEEAARLYQNTSKDLQAKEKIIEDMRLTLVEQEQTQMEQDRVLEAKVEENGKLTAELERWKQKYTELENSRSTREGCEKTDAEQEASNTEAVSTEVIMLQNKLKEFEEKYSSDRKKWLEEKMVLITQAKEAEQQRNREMRKYVEDRERHTKLQSEVEIVSSQLLEKDKDLQKWREERDQLVAALEIQLKSLLSSNVQKDKEIKELRANTAEGTKEENPSVTKELRSHIERDETTKELKQQLSDLEQFKILQSLNTTVAVITEDHGFEQPEESQTMNTGIPKQSLHFSNSKHSEETEAVFRCPSSNTSSQNEFEGHFDTVLDSSSMSTESGRVSRFPKPELEIQFTPLQPNKMAVKHQDSAIPITVKISRTARKRKSSEMEEVMVKDENRKNATLSSTMNTLLQCNAATGNKEEEGAARLKLQKSSTLKKQISSSSTRSHTKKERTLQKLGDLLQSSPTILHTKAKKLIETISSPKPVEAVFHKEPVPKPKRGRRKLYSTDISSPLDIPAHSIIMNRKEKESDHLIIKRRLRTKTAR